MVGEYSSPHVHHDPQFVNSSCALPLPKCSTGEKELRKNSDGFVLHDDEEDLDLDLGLGDSNVCPDRPSPDNPKTLPDSRSGLFESWSYLKWCASLVPLVLRSRTPLASFLSKTIKLSKSHPQRMGLASTFFPVPIPCFEVFDRMPDSSSVSKRHAYHTAKAVHVISMTLNHWHFGGRWCDLELLRREPNRQHVSHFQRLRFLIRSDWPAYVSHLPKAGRRFPQLIARISELSDCLTRIGPSSNPYEKSFDGCPVPTDNTVMPELSPYRDLEPSRLRIRGNGKWDATPFLDDSLSMVYREPATIRFSDVPSVVPSIRDHPDTIGELARIWDVRGLLYLHDRPVGISSHVKIFNTLKNHSQDRQIGDRRAMNSQGSIVRGPSSDLPAGSDLASLLLDPRRQSIAISITDRSDFYHQFMSTDARAYTNTLGPCVDISQVADTSAYASFRARSSARKNRERGGDHLEEFVPSPLLVPPDPGKIWVAFGSVLQGDHAGVEIATESHSNLLRCYGLLAEGTQIVASSPLRSFSEAQGLVIDDFFSISIQDKTIKNDDSISASNYRLAQAAYCDHGLQGSPEKDIISQNEGKVIGAYINGGHRAVSRGIVTVAAPIEKRLGLSLLSLFVSQLSHTSDALHLCLLGGWTSVLGYRRPLMSVLQAAFDSRVFDANNPVLVRLPRSVATELVTLAVLMPLCTSDIAAPLDSKLYCTDASLDKGAILSTTLDERIMRILYRSTITKGSYTRMLSLSSSLLKSHDWSFEEFDEDGGAGEVSASPERPVAFHYEFIEVYAGSAKVTHYLSKKGILCGPPLDLSLSPEYDVSLPHVIGWLTFMVSEKRLRGFMVEPPCTTYSIMRRPRLRSKQKPLGFRPCEEKTRVGNVLSSRGGQLMHVGARHGAVGLLETPFSSYMKHMPFWKILETFECFKTVRCDSCRYHSPHLKSFRFLCLNLETDLISLRCVCNKKHLPVEGSLTKASAIYTDSLSESLAETFARALYSRRVPKDEGKSAGGLESLFVNEVMLSSTWQKSSVWTFKKKSHINILEESALLRCVASIAKQARSVRSIIITDSNVVKGATTKGRTSSRGL